MHAHAPQHHCEVSTRHELRGDWFLSQGSCLGGELGQTLVLLDSTGMPLPTTPRYLAICDNLLGGYKEGRWGGSVGLGLRVPALLRPGTKSPTEKNKQALLRVLLSSCSQGTPSGRGGLPALIPQLFSF